MRKFLFIYSAFLLLLNFPLNAQTPDFKTARIDSLFRLLDAEIARKDQYDATKQKRINNLTELYFKEKDTARKLTLNEKLYSEYMYYIYDSAVYYINRNIELLKHFPDQSRLFKSQMILSNLYITNGVYWEAENILYHLDCSKCTPSEKAFILNTEARLYFYMHHTVIIPINKEKYLNRFLSIRESLLKMGFDDQVYLADIRFYYYLFDGDYEKINRFCEEILNNYDEHNRLYSVAYEWKAQIAGFRKEPEEELYYLILAAIYEQRNSIKNGDSTYRLAKVMFDYNRIHQAHKYVMVVHHEANQSNSMRHKARASELTSIISKKYEENLQDHQNKLYGYIWVIGLLSIVMVVVVITLILQMKKLSHTKNKLQESHLKQVKLNDQLNRYNDSLLQNNTLKEEYLGVFLQLRPYYIENLNEYRKNVLRLIREKRIPDLYEFCKSDKNIFEEYEKSHREFDKMFLDIFPDFVEQFNALLNEDARVEPKLGELTIEMRIYAFIRLGINDSATIARYLHYSVNTIYNYRSRIKQKTICPKEDFESEIKKIGCSV